MPKKDCCKRDVSVFFPETGFGGFVVGAPSDARETLLQEGEALEQKSKFNEPHRQRRIHSADVKSKITIHNAGRSTTQVHCTPWREEGFRGTVGIAFCAEWAVIAETMPETKTEPRTVYLSICLNRPSSWQIFLLYVDGTIT